MTANIAMRFRGVRNVTIARSYILPTGHCQVSFHTARRAQENVNPSPDRRTTHFGFETVPESAKESKGDLMMMDLCNVY